MKCPYCGGPVQLVGGDAIYPHRSDLFSKKFHQCKPCDAYVGCHPGTTQPLGRLANRQLRQRKVAAHAAFDPIWKEGRLKRTQAYAWLAKEMGVAPKDCHIGMFDVEQCEQVIEICSVTP